MSSDVALDAPGHADSVHPPFRFPRLGLWFAARVDFRRDLAAAAAVAVAVVAAVEEEEEAGAKSLATKKEAGGFERLEPVWAPVWALAPVWELAPV